MPAADAAGRVQPTTTCARRNRTNDPNRTSLMLVHGSGRRSALAVSSARRDARRRHNKAPSMQAPPPRGVAWRDIPARLARRGQETSGTGDEGRDEAPRVGGWGPGEPPELPPRVG